MTSRARSWCRWLTTGVTVVVVAAACGGGDEGLSVDDTWGRPSPPTAETTAFYLDIDNDTDVDDQLVGATTSACAMVEIHRTAMDDGVMSMAPADPDELVVAAGGGLELEPGGLHLMCMGLSAPLAQGDVVDITLTFASAGDITVEADIDDR